MSAGRHRAQLSAQRSHLAACLARQASRPLHPGPTWGNRGSDWYPRLQSWGQQSQNHEPVYCLPAPAALHSRSAEEQSLSLLQLAWPRAGPGGQGREHLGDASLHKGAAKIRPARGAHVSKLL